MMMYFYLFGIHILLVFSYAIFFLQFIKSLQHNAKDKFLFGILSLVFMILVLVVGSKLILLNPLVFKTGIWLHIKLTFFIVVMLQNLILLYAMFKKINFSSKFYEITYWLYYIVFLIMISLSVFKFI